MLKGFIFSISPKIFIVLICVGIIGFLGLELVTQTVSYGEVTKESIESLNAIDASNLIEYCLSNEDGLIELDTLIQNSGKTMCQIEQCQICEISMGIKVGDTTNQNEWFFGYDNSKGTDYESFVKIKDVSETHVGKIYVQVF